MYIGVNVIGLVPGQRDAEEHYFRHVVAALCRLQPSFRFLLFTDPDNHEAFEGWERHCVTGKPFGGLLGAGALEKAVRQTGVDLLFSPLRTAPTKLPVPQVLLVLGLYACEVDAQAGKLSSRRIKEARKKCMAAGALVTPTQYLQRRCMDLFEMPLDRIVVARPGVGNVFAKDQPPSAEPPYLMTVGTTHELSNITRLRQALALLKDDIPHNLVVVGLPDRAEPDSWGARVVRVDRCPAAQLAGLYQHTALFVYPVLYDGAGTTVLEAMASGAAVVAARVGAIPEVAGDLPIYFDPVNVSAMAEAIRRGLEESEEDHARRAKFGRRRAAEFLWKDCAARVLSAFRHSLGT